MKLVHVTDAATQTYNRYYIDGKRVTKRAYDSAKDSAAILECFLTESISVRGGFAGYRHSVEVR